MRVTLKTRCGCTRMMDVPYPPNRHIIVPMLPDISAFYKDVNLVPELQTRRFEIRRFEQRGPVGSFAEYEEVLDGKRENI